jgi:hypothetical protein
MFLGAAPGAHGQFAEGGDVGERVGGDQERGRAAYCGHQDEGKQAVAPLGTTGYSPILCVPRAIPRGQTVLPDLERDGPAPLAAPAAVARAAVTVNAATHPLISPA